jgi:predicted lipoprotein with Yx(FWY)xxD motif
MSHDKRRVVAVSVIGRVLASAAAVATLSGFVASVGHAGAAEPHHAKLTVVKTSSFGKVLADGDTVYTLKPSSVPCTAKCRVIWPPVVLPSGVKHPSAGHGVLASKLGTRRVKGVGLQVTYKGKLLYWYFRDTAPGQVNGALTDRWGKWSPVVLSKSKTGTASTSGSNAGTGGVSF